MKEGNERMGGKKEELEEGEWERGFFIITLGVFILAWKKKVLINCQLNREQSIGGNNVEKLPNLPLLLL